MTLDDIKPVLQQLLDNGVIEVEFTMKDETWGLFGEEAQHAAGLETIIDLDGGSLRIMIWKESASEEDDDDDAAGSSKDMN